MSTFDGEGEKEVVGMPNTKYKVVGIHTEVGIKATSFDEEDKKHYTSEHKVKHFVDIEEV